MLSARDLAQLLLCTCNALRQRLMTFESVLVLLRDRGLHGLCAVDVSAQYRHAWRYATFDPHVAGLASRALHWVDKRETAILHENFLRCELADEFDMSGSGTTAGIWRRFGPLQQTDIRRIEPMHDVCGSSNSEGGLARPLPSAQCCLSLAISRTYGQSAMHFGRGVTCRITLTEDEVAQLTQRIERIGSSPIDRGEADGLRPLEVSCLFRLRLDLYGGLPTGRRRAARASRVGYFIVSDGDEHSTASQGVFGAEALFLFIVIGPNHTAQLMAADGSGLATPVACVPSGVWLYLCCSFNWKARTVGITCHDFHSAKWGDAPSPTRQVSFRGECAGLRQLSLLSVSDAGHATISWTDILISP